MKCNNKHVRWIMATSDMFRVKIPILGRKEKGKKEPKWLNTVWLLYWYKRNCMPWIWKKICTNMRLAETSKTKYWDHWLFYWFKGILGSFLITLNWLGGHIYTLGKWCMLKQFIHSGSGTIKEKLKIHRKFVILKWKRL